MSTNTNTSNSSKPQKPRHPSIVNGVLHAIFKIAGMSLFAWFVIVLVFLVEFILKDHSSVMTQAQSILNGNVDFIRANHSPLTGFVVSLLLRVHQSINEFYSFINLTIQQIPVSQNFLKFVHVKDYQNVIATCTNFLKVVFVGTEITLARLGIFVLALPFLCTVLVVALMDGLVIRDVRRFQSARESTFIFHHAKHLSGFWFYSLFFIYMMLPFFIQPTLFLFVLTATLAMTTRLSTVYFKKYL